MTTPEKTQGELLPCPFCGGKAADYSVHTWCLDTECAGHSTFTHRDAWNTRPTPQPAREGELSRDEIESLRSAYTSPDVSSQLMASRVDALCNMALRAREGELSREQIEEYRKSLYGNLHLDFSIKQLKKIHTDICDMALRSLDRPADSEIKEAELADTLADKLEWALKLLKNPVLYMGKPEMLDTFEKALQGHAAHRRKPSPTPPKEGGEL